MRYRRYLYLKVSTKGFYIRKSYDCMKKRYNNDLEMSIAERALDFFLKNPSQEVYLREYGRILKISPNSAQRFLNRFAARGYVVEQRRGNLRYFKANLESLVFRQLKIIASLKELEVKGVLSLLQECGASHAVLFGSVSEGKDDEKSDIDILVITSSKEDVRKALAGVQKSLSRELSTQIFTWVEWRGQEKNNKAFYREVIMKGISLLGEKPVIS